VSNDVVMYQIDSKTLSEIHEIVTALQDHIEWLLGRNDQEAVGRLLPTMKQLHRLVTYVYSQNSDEFDDLITPIQQQADQFSQMLKDASTPETIVEIEKLFEEYSQALDALLKRSKDDATR
jgi:ribosomal protein S15P/S13E